jgi:hypothetical protein
MEIDRAAPATQGDLLDLKGELKGDLLDLKGELKGDLLDLKYELKQDIAMIRSEMQHTFDALIERMADNQTELLKAFYGFPTSTDVKLKDGEQSDAMLRQRLSTVESRLLEVEKRLNMPPAA